MGGKEDGPAPVAHLPHNLFQVVGGFGVQTHKGLVQQHQFGFVDQSCDQRELLFHAVGIGAHAAAQVAGQLEQVGIIMDALLPLFAGHFKNIRHKVQIPDARQKFIEVRVVWNIGDPLFAFQGIVFDRKAVHRDGPFFIGQNTRHRFDGGGLSCAVVADEPEDLPGPDLQGQVIHRYFVAIPLGIVGDLEHLSFLRCLQLLLLFILLQQGLFQCFFFFIELGQFHMVAAALFHLRFQRFQPPLVRPSLLSLRAGMAFSFFSAGLGAGMLCRWASCRRRDSWYSS